MTSMEQDPHIAILKKFSIEKDTKAKSNGSDQKEKIIKSLTIGITQIRGMSNRFSDKTFPSNCLTTCTHHKNFRTQKIFLSQWCYQEGQNKKLQVKLQSYLLAWTKVQYWVDRVSSLFPILCQIWSKTLTFPTCTWTKTPERKISGEEPAIGKSKTRNQSQYQRSSM